MQIVILKREREREREKKERVTKQLFDVSAYVCSVCIFKQVKEASESFDNGGEASNSKRRKKNVSNLLIDSFSTTITSTMAFVV